MPAKAGNQGGHGGTFSTPDQVRGDVLGQGNRHGVVSRQPVRHAQSSRCAISIRLAATSASGFERSIASLRKAL